MAKYDPLKRFLARQKADAVLLSFNEIDGLIGGLLPKGAARPDWWATDGDAKQVQQAAWRETGFTAILIPREDRVRFSRTARP
jgi:hypothetical protein